MAESQLIRFIHGSIQEACHCPRTPCPVSMDNLYKDKPLINSMIKAPCQSNNKFQIKELHYIDKWLNLILGYFKLLQSEILYGTRSLLQAECSGCPRTAVGLLGYCHNHSWSSSANFTESSQNQNEKPEQTSEPGQKLEPGRKSGYDILTVSSIGWWDHWHITSAVKRIVNARF